MPPERIIARLVAGQHGVATTQQFQRAGITRAQLRHRALSGLLVPVHRGVWRVTTHPRTPEQAIAAAVLAAGDGALAAQRSDARLWGLELDGLDAIDIVVPAHRHPVVPGVHVHRTSDLVDLEPSYRLGIPCTNPLRLLVDLGAVLPRRRRRGARAAARPPPGHGRRRASGPGQARPARPRRLRRSAARAR